MKKGAETRRCEDTTSGEGGGEELERVVLERKELRELLGIYMMGPKAHSWIDSAANQL